MAAIVECPQCYGVGCQVSIRHPKTCTMCGGTGVVNASAAKEKAVPAIPDGN